MTPEPLAPKPDPQKAYAEACSTLRHYSTASLSVRTVSVVQGLVLLGVYIVALREERLALAIGVAMAGMLFTGLLYRFHKGYFRAIEFFYKAAASMEKRLFDEGFRPFSDYNREHARLYATRTSKFLTLNAPFTLVGTLFLLGLGIASFLWLRS